MKGMVLEFVQFFGEAAAEDGEAAPGLGIEVGVVEVEAGSVAFAFPLVATPKLEEAFDPSLVLLGLVLREGFGDVLQDVFRAALVADGPLLDLVEERVGHEVAFVGLFGFAGAELGGRLLFVDRGEAGMGGFRGCRFLPSSGASDGERLCRCRRWVQVLRRCRRPWWRSRPQPRSDCWW